jgi:hypothetical protein
MFTPRIHRGELRVLRNLGLTVSPLLVIIQALSLLFTIRKVTTSLSEFPLLHLLAMEIISMQRPSKAWNDLLLNQVNNTEHANLSKSGRKQHRSCDQCRKGKRGCDAIILKEPTHPPNSSCSDVNGFHVEGTNSARGGLKIYSILPSKISNTILFPEIFPVGPCSNCSKTSKNCTFEWLRSQESNSIERANDRSGPPPKRARLTAAGSQTDNRSLNALPSYADESRRSFSSSSIPSSRALHCVQSEYSPATCQSETTNSSNESVSPNLSTHQNAGKGPKHRKRPLYKPTNISPFSIPEKLVTFTNKSLISESLMRVYHDSLENALSCWLTERTCPYGARALPSNATHSIDPSMLREWGPDWSNRICRQVFNLDRVSASIRDRPLAKSEDRAASNALNLAIMAFASQWSQSSERSKAKFPSLHTDGRTQEHLTNHVTGSPELEDVSDESDAGRDFARPEIEFDRIIQESFWTQARNAIQAAAHIESFRVVFAHIIFALTQRPLSTGEHSHHSRLKVRRPLAKPKNTISTPASESSRQTNSPTDFVDKDTVDNHIELMEELESVLDYDGPPIFLEQGLRHIHSFRCKLDRLRMQNRKSNDEGGIPDPAVTESPSNPLSQQNWKTVDLLYWLSVMFDTLSAAMHKRPLVVSDEDSDVTSDIPSHSSNRRTCESNNSKLNGSSNLWNSFFFEEQQTRRKSSPVRWPCSYETAAATLADAAPIKVLLFRKVTRIQTLISRHILRETLEEAIQDALRVYRYWNDVYGPFILDCISNHDQLPARIQSWYICLTGHWHLAVFLLADIIEAIDGHLGLESHRRERKSSGLVNTLRQRSAYAVADLASCSCPREDASFPDARDFHFAVNQGALLTEPWTQVLIRVFAKASALLLLDATKFKYGIETVESCKWALQRSEDCVEALWYLGRKSDMAFLAARVLTKALGGPRESIAAAEPPQYSGDRFMPYCSVDNNFSLSAPSSESDGFFPGVGEIGFDISVDNTALDFDVESAAVTNDFDGYNNYF